MSAAGGRRRHDVFDVVLAVALLTAGLVDWSAHVFGGVFPGSRWAHLPFVIATALPVAMRRRAPLVALISVGVLQSVWIYGLYPVQQQPPLTPFLALIVVVYSAAAYADGRAARAAWVTVALGMLSSIPTVLAGEPVGRWRGRTSRC